jgi:hypothetical protein
MPVGLAEFTGEGFSGCLDEIDYLRAESTQPSIININRNQRPNVLLRVRNIPPDLNLHWVRTAHLEVSAWLLG